MYKTQPSSRAIQRAQISWQQAQIDFKEAKTVLELQPHKSSLLSTQAAMNALSSILEARGYFQFPVFSTSELLKKCIEEEKVFEVLHSACAVLDSTVGKRHVSIHTHASSSIHACLCQSLSQSMWENPESNK